MVGMITVLSVSVSTVIIGLIIPITKNIWAANKLFLFYSNGNLPECQKSRPEVQSQF